MHADRPFTGILLMLGFCVVAPLADSIAKVLGDNVALGLLLSVRFGIQALVLLPLGLRAGLQVPAGLHGFIVLRTILHIFGIGLMFTALRFLPLADALAIAFVMPFIMLLLGYFILHEEIGKHRLVACAIGFSGTLLVIQPNFATVGWPALLPLGVAVIFALFMLVTRRIARHIDPISLQTISGFQAFAMLLPLLILFPDAPGLTLAWPSGRSVILLLALGLLGTFAHLMMTWSLRLAPAATLAPMQYLEIPFGTLIGWMIFRDLPNGLAALGICITIGAGLYIILREQRLSRQAMPPPAA